MAVGRKAEAYLRFRGYKLDRTFSGFSDSPSYEDAREVAEHAMALYDEGRVDRVELVYTRFVSAGSQEVVQRPLFPLEPELVAAGTGRRPMPLPPGRPPTTSTSRHRRPSSTRWCPATSEARTYAAFLNAAASEHAFRQRAMKAATDNADELIKTLSRVMNRARQDTITTEIMEIVGGAEALGADKRDDDSATHILELLDPQGV